MWVVHDVTGKQIERTECVSWRDFTINGFLKTGNSGSNIPQQLVYVNKKMIEYSPPMLFRKYIGPSH
jgi:hypothetical protein